MSFANLLLLPVPDAARTHASLNGSRAFLYCFRHPTRFDAYPRWAEGVHGDDLAYVFGAPLVPPTDGGGGGVEPFPSAFTRADRALSETVIRYWTNFMRTG